ncbi:rbm25 protein, putative, partial [Ichthyophthirius multifiliis]
FYEYFKKNKIKKTEAYIFQHKIIQKGQLQVPGFQNNFLNPQISQLQTPVQSSGIFQFQQQQMMGQFGQGFVGGPSQLSQMQQITQVPASIPNNSLLITQQNASIQADSQWRKLFVNNIHQDIPDDFVKTLLEECGPIEKWKRNKDEKGNYLKFGYIEYKYVEGVLKCVRLLDGFDIMDQQLVIKPSQTTQKFIEEWKKLKRKQFEDEKFYAKQKEDQNEEIHKFINFDQFLEKDDQKILERIQQLMKVLDEKVEKVREKKREEEDRKLHPRERERERIRKQQVKDMERKFKEKLKEWLEHEEDKTKEKKKEKDREKEREKIRQKNFERELNYTDDIDRHKYKGKTMERRKLRQRELEEDEQERKKELELPKPPEPQFHLPMPDENMDFQDQNQININNLQSLQQFNLLQQLQQPFQNSIITAKKQLTPEELKTQIAEIFKKIPNNKQDLYNYNINWTFFEASNLLEKKVRPHLCKKSQELLGQEEPEFVNMIIKKIQSKEHPEKIQKKVSKILDEEAEGFITSLWKMIIFEMLKYEKELQI